MRRWLAAGACAVVVVAGLVFAIRPGLTRERTFPAEIDSPSSLFSSAGFPGRHGQRICMAPAVMEEHSEQVQFKVSLVAKRPEPLELGITGPGVRVARRVAPRYVDGQVVAVDVPAPRAATVVRVCLRNLGRHS